MKNYIFFKDALELLNVDTVSKIYDICFYNNIQIYAEHPIRKDIREVYEAESPIAKSVKMNFGLNEVEINVVNGYEKIIHDMLNTNDLVRRKKIILKAEPFEQQLEKWNLYVQKNKKRFFHEISHRFHCSKEGVFWKNRFVLIEPAEKNYSLIKKTELLILEADIQKLNDHLKIKYLFDKNNFCVFVDQEPYVLGTTQFNIIKAIYDLTAKTSTFVGRSEIVALAKIYPTKGLPTIFKIKNSTENFFWKNFIEIFQIKSKKKDEKSSKVNGVQYRIRCQKSHNYHIDRG